MANYKDIYITAQEYNFIELTKMPYEGFVEGVGYVSMHQRAVKIPYADNNDFYSFQIPISLYTIDYSDYALERSYKNHYDLVEDKITALVAKEEGLDLQSVHVVLKDTGSAIWVHTSVDKKGDNSSTVWHPVRLSNIIYNIDNLDVDILLKDTAEYLPHEIFFKDNSNHLIASFMNDKLDTTIVFNTVNVQKDLSIDLNRVSDKIGGLDVVGINFGGEFTAVVGADANVEYAFFLSGKDAFHGAFFRSTGFGVGLGAGAGVTAFGGQYLGKKEEMSMKSFTGNTSSYNLGYKNFALSYWWGNNLNTLKKPSFYPGMGAHYSPAGPQTWQGISLGAASGLKYCITIDNSTTSFLEWANKAAKTIPYTKGYK